MLMVLAAFSSIHAHDHGNFKGISLFFYDATRR